MAGSITLSAGIRSNLLSLQSTQNSIAQTQTRLSTGKKVNSALDNPTNFFTASSLNTRASDLSSLLDGIGQGISTLQAADQGLSTLTNLVKTAQGAARQALGSAATNGKVTSNLSTSLAADGSTTLASLGYDAADVIRFSDGTNNVDVTVGTATVQDAITQINASANLTAKISNGQLSVENKTGGNLTVSLTTDTNSLGLGSLLGATVATGASKTFTGTSNTTRTTAAAQFKQTLTQIDQLVSDTGYNGVNLLNGDSLKVTFNERNTSSLTIAGAKFDSAGLNFSATDTTNNFQNDAEINASLDKLSAALTTIRNQSATFGANLNIVKNRQEFTQNLISTLNSGADQLTSANTTEEGANLLALQTRQQLGVTALSLASQSDQAVLRLF